MEFPLPFPANALEEQHIEILFFPYFGIHLRNTGKFFRSCRNIVGFCITSRYFPTTSGNSLRNIQKRR